MHPYEGNGSLEDRRLQIAVAGGSIGGLCAGLALHGSGFDVNVYERHPGPMDTRGAGIVVQGELVQLLDTYGAPPLPTTSCHVRRYLDPQGGDGQVQSMPQAFTSWEAIYETLRVAFPKERYHMGATLVGVNDPGDGQAVSAEIEGHGHTKTDLLVCADGAQSPTRRRLLPDVQSIYADRDPPNEVEPLYQTLHRDSMAATARGLFTVNFASSIYAASARRQKDAHSMHCETASGGSARDCLATPV